MTNKEFSDGFSTLLNSFDITPNITLDEYEKSTFLTNAQEQLIIDIYSGRNVIYGKSMVLSCCRPLLYIINNLFYIPIFFSKFANELKE